MIMVPMTSYIPADNVSCSSHESDSEMDADDFQHVEKSAEQKSEHSVVTEHNENNFNTDVELRNGQVYYGRNKCISWNMQKPASHKVRQSKDIDYEALIGLMILCAISKSG
ncbi:hypothetical protein PR048_030570 [Dryococelus australis]|uniref:Uncharacterized protein n=1 Tax=Dryococelus australis TaxID=614101 RepID=A0ABQ9GD73_9NEOP|nr:hypothetical protein PR048_030570 [Dryococelus australis]